MERGVKEDRAKGLDNHSSMYGAIAGRDVVPSAGVRKGWPKMNAQASRQNICKLHTFSARFITASTRESSVVHISVNISCFIVEMRRVKGAKSVLARDKRRGAGPSPDRLLC